MTWHILGALDTFCWTRHLETHKPNFNCQCSRVKPVFQLVFLKVSNSTMCYHLTSVIIFFIVLHLPGIVTKFCDLEFYIVCSAIVSWSCQLSVEVVSWSLHWKTNNHPLPLTCILVDDVQTWPDRRSWHKTTCKLTPALDMCNCKKQQKHHMHMTSL